MDVIVLWKAVQTAVVDTVSVESTVIAHGNVAVTMAGMDETVALLWNRAVVMEGTMTRVSSCFSLVYVAFLTVCFNIRQPYLYLPLLWRWQSLLNLVVTEFQ
jgi:hypothetical protein